MWQVYRGGGSTTTVYDDGGTSTSGSITSTSYTIEELESGTIYSITVVATNVAGSTVSQPIIIVTGTEEEST